LSLGKAPFPYLHPDTTFIASHNGCELKPILEMCPVAFSNYLLLGLFPLLGGPADPPAWLSTPRCPIVLVVGFSIDIAMGRDAPRKVLRRRGSSPPEEIEDEDEDEDERIDAPPEPGYSGGRSGENEIKTIRDLLVEP
jgi:hypothetical protein